MREIKFRGKIKSVGDFAYGLLTTDSYKHRRWIGFVASKTYYEVEVYPETVGQFTGMKDVDGNDVYEGDILTFEPYEWNRSSLKPKREWEHPYWVVSWNEENAEWNLGGGTSSETPTYKKVIGNIHQKGWEEKIKEKAKQAQF